MRRTVVWCVRCQTARPRSQWRTATYLVGQLKVCRNHVGQVFGELLEDDGVPDVRKIRRTETIRLVGSLL